MAPVTASFSWDGSLRLSTERPVGMGPSAAAGSANTGAALKLPDGGRAVFSALQQSVYLVGGALDGQPIASVLRYNLVTSELKRVVAGAAAQPSQTVLAAVYDFARRTIYALDVASGKHNRKLARLVAYDLDANRSRVLLEVPYVALASRVGLAVADDGYLILVTGGNQHHMAWRINPFGAYADFAGVLNGHGVMMDAPLAGLHEPMLPVIDNGKLRFESLGRTSFHPGKLCDGI